MHSSIGAVRRELDPLSGCVCHRIIDISSPCCRFPPVLSETTKSKSILVPSPKSRRTMTVLVCRDLHAVPVLVISGVYTTVHVGHSRIATLRFRCGSGIPITGGASIALHGWAWSTPTCVHCSITCLRTFVLDFHHQQVRFEWGAIIGASAEKIISSTRAVLMRLVRLAAAMILPPSGRFSPSLHHRARVCAVTLPSVRRYHSIPNPQPQRRTNDIPVTITRTSSPIFNH